MPPHPPVPAGQSRVSSSTSTSSAYGYAQLSKLLLLVLLVATGIRLAIINFLTRRRRTVAHLPALIQEKDPKLCQAPSEKDLRQHRHVQSNDQPPAFQPVYPWTSPPQPLPGPYDARLYPLPTIRRHSYDPSVVVPAANSTISYTRRVSTNSIPTHTSTIHGTVTTSTKGWRRNQWVISGE